MLRLRTLSTLALLVLSMAILSKRAAAFQYGGQAWCCDTINYYVNPTDPSSSCGNMFAVSWFQGLINSAAGAWNAEGTTFQLVDSGTTNTGCQPVINPDVCAGVQDGQNTISMATGCNWIDGNVIAYSTWWYWTQGDSACCIFEGDICFNDNATWYNNLGACSGSCYDLISVAEHEIGHWISSGHENDDGVLGYKPIMYFSFNFCEMRRAVTPDDSALVQWAYDSNGVINLNDRCDPVHQHPPYTPAPAHDICVAPPCPAGAPFCDSVSFNSCLLVCPASDEVFTVTLKDSCGNPICDSANTWLSFANCPQALPCPGKEPDWPRVFPDSCDPVTGNHYFTVDAGHNGCATCLVDIFVGGSFCAQTQVRFFDTNGDLCVTQADFLGGQPCADYNCDFASDPNDSLIWAAHFAHCCSGQSLCCEFHKAPYTDYAPSGMPDFDQKQHDWKDVMLNWSWCGPLAVANCLWWFDSKLDSLGGPAPPVISDGYPLVTAFGNWDDHDSSNVFPYVEDIAGYMSVDNPAVGKGTHIDSLVSGTQQYIAAAGLQDYFIDTLVEFPSYSYISAQVFESYDVILLLGFYTDLGGGNCCRFGGHYVTVAGACSTDTKLCISDPYFDLLEGEPPAGSSHGSDVHNDALNISGPHGQIQHDQIRLTPAGFACPAGIAELVNEYPMSADLINFEGQNGESSIGCPPPTFAVVEWAYVICDTCPLDTFHLDGDGDGYGIPGLDTVTCAGAPPPGYSDNDIDCDDGDVNVNPGETEVCDGKDNDCNTLIDDGVTNTYYLDSDGDGFGTVSVDSAACTAPAGYVTDNTDCDDGDINVNPGETEVCDGKDNDCNTLIDEGVTNTYYLDSDGDGFGTVSVDSAACTAPAGYVTDNTDCDDGDINVNPGETEICGNNIDDNCDGNIDEGCSCCLKAGDADDGGDVNIGDATFIVKYIFQSGSTPPCCDQADADGGGDINIGDATHIVKFIFQNGAAPKCPALSIASC